MAAISRAVMTPARFAWVLVVVVSCFAASARAQECAEGRVASEATAGRCCWPGQAWDAEHGRCSGPPSCPAGRVAEGDACVSPSAPVVVPSAPPPVAPSGPVHRMYDEHVIGGIATLAAAYLVTAVVGTVDGTWYDDASGLFCWIPIAGGVLWGLGRDEIVPWAMGISGAVVQAAGLALLLVGVVGHDVDTEQVLVLPSAPGAEAGASIAVRF